MPCLLCSAVSISCPVTSLPPSPSDVDDVLRRANATEYGLASGVFTRDINKALYVSEKLNAGTVFVNTYNKTDVASPFGGFKQSGFGKDLGKSTGADAVQLLSLLTPQRFTSVNLDKVQQFVMSSIHTYCLFLSHSNRTRGSQRIPEDKGSHHRVLSQVTKKEAAKHQLPTARGSDGWLDNKEETEGIDRVMWRVEECPKIQPIVMSQGLFCHYQLLTITLFVP